MGKIKHCIISELESNEAGKLAYCPIDITDYHGKILDVFGSLYDAENAIRENEEINHNTVCIIYKFFSGYVYESKIYWDGKTPKSLNKWNEIGFYDKYYMYHGFQQNHFTNK